MSSDLPAPRRGAEAHWIAWKLAGCREFERNSLEMLHAKIPPADVLSKRPRLARLALSLLRLRSGADQSRHAQVPRATGGIKRDGLFVDVAF